MCNAVTSEGINKYEDLGAQSDKPLLVRVASNATRYGRGERCVRAKCTTALRETLTEHRRALSERGILLNEEVRYRNDGLYLTNSSYHNHKCTPLTIEQG